MKILVDADGCPSREIIEKIAKKYDLSLVFITDASHLLESDYAQIVTVDEGKDSVDFYLINHLKSKDLVVSQDYGVATMALGKKAYAIHNSGLIYTDENIDELLMRRHIRQSEKRHHKGHGPRIKKRTKEDESRFAHNLEMLVLKNLDSINQVQKSIIPPNNMESIDFYNLHTESFIEGTFNVEMSELRNRFLEYVPKAGALLDLGCGSGRDAKAFLELGYDIYAVDGSVEMVNHCKQYLGNRVICRNFEDYTAPTKLDGIWACASLLHVYREELVPIIDKYGQWLKSSGVFFLNFKKGNGPMIHEHRYFNNYTEETIEVLIKQLNRWQILELWTSEDVRVDHVGEEWINLIMRPI